MSSNYFDDPAFIQFLIGNLSVSYIQEAFQKYLELNQAIESFEQWLANLDKNPGAQQAIRSIYELDQFGKQTNQAITMNIRAVKKTAKAHKQPVKLPTEAQIEAFSKYLAEHGMSDM